ncbi:MAG: fluoride efflux transporter CrcB [Hydrogenobacter sp.]
MGLMFVIAIGGALGSVLRYELSKIMQEKAGLDFPFGTFVVNLLACFLVGFFFSYLVEKMDLSSNMRAFLITGFLGGFSTFSTFSYESYYLLVNGELLKFLLYILGSVGGGIFMTLLEYNLGRVL